MVEAGRSWRWSSVKYDMTTQLAKTMDTTPATDENFRLERLRRRQRGKRTVRPTMRVMEVRPAA
jgi:hypothetical protein